MKNSAGSKKNKVESEQIYAAIFENTVDSIVIIGLDGNILDWNRGSEILYGYTKSEALKMNILDLSPAPYKEHMKIILDEIIAGQKIRTVETKRITKDKRILDIGLTLTELKRNRKLYAVATIGRDFTRYLQMEAALKDLPRQLILAREDERRKIAQDIHDDLGQSLIAIKMLFPTDISGFTEIDNKRLLEQIRTRIGDIIDKTRDLSHNLYPPNLKYMGLPLAIAKMVESISHDKKIKIKLIHRNMSRVNIESIGIIIYRMVQEALTNVIKHADATEISVKMVYKQGRLSVEIVDNGKGFNSNHSKKSDGIGLALMREGVKIINGTLFVDSRPGEGTTVRAVIPALENVSNE
jgi:PAS domain S-box-containing protein